MAVSGTSPQVPEALRRWFLVHFVLDVVFALPLMIVPQWFLTTLGWEQVDPVATRLVAAALLGIGIESLLSQRAPLGAFGSLLNLKIIWSSAAVLGIAMGIVEGAHGVPWSLWGFLAIFVGFNVLWVWWRVHVGRLLQAAG